MRHSGWPSLPLYWNSFRGGKIASRIAELYYQSMIRSFRHKGLAHFYQTGSKRGIQAAHASKLNRILGLLDVAITPDDLDLPAFRLHPLKGALQGYWSIWVNGNWRITFRFVGTDVELIDYQDYH